MNAKKARAIRKVFGVKHARHAKLTRSLVRQMPRALAKPGSSILRAD